MPRSAKHSHTVQCNTNRCVQPRCHTTKKSRMKEHPIYAPQDTLSASFPPPRPGNEVLASYIPCSWNAFCGWQFSVQDYPSAAGQSCLARESVDHKKAWNFLFLTKNFLRFSLYFFSPQLLVLFYQRIIFGKETPPQVSWTSCSSSQLQLNIAWLFSGASSIPCQNATATNPWLSSSPAAFASLTGDIALFLVAWLPWLGWNDAEKQWRKISQK